MWRAARIRRTRSRITYRRRRRLRSRVLRRGKGRCGRNFMHPALGYFESVRTRTLRVVEHIPEGKLDWSYRAGKFTLGDVWRHLALVERKVFAQAAQGLAPEYKGCGKEFGATKTEISELMARFH